MRRLDVAEKGRERERVRNQGSWVGRNDPEGLTPFCLPGLWVGCLKNKHCGERARLNLQEGYFENGAFITLCVLIKLQCTYFL